MTKAKTRFGTVYPAEQTSYSAIIIPRKEITLFKSGVKGVTFKMGDVAEYDSYNLTYLGTITGITDKCVTITAYIGTRNAKVHRLSLDSFCWRNWGFDLVKIQAQNEDTMMYI
jgi:hypothetical protein